MKLDTLKYNTLIKLITFVKFGCEDSESRYYAASPIIGEILEELIVEFNQKINKDVTFELKVPSPVFNLVNEGVKRNLKSTVEWANMNDESKMIHLKNLAYPYTLRKEHLIKLLENANNWHNNK